MKRVRPLCPTLCSLALLAVPLAIVSDARGNNRPHHGGNANEVTVRCDKGRTIGDALANYAGPLTIKVFGTCDEHVVVERDDVRMIAGEQDAGIHGLDANRDTLFVTGHRFVLDGLAVTGGRNALVLSGGGRATISNCATRGSGSGIVGGIGIAFRQGANGVVDNCESTGNTADGLLLDASIATITNSAFSSNGRTGILVFNGSTARIGMNDLLAPAPNEVKDNGSTGIYVTLGSMAVILNNTITGNGTNPAAPLLRAGVAAFHSRIDLPGGNTITGNAGQGVSINSSTASIGDVGFGLPPLNTISGNSTAGPSQGINVFLSTLILRNATVTKHNGPGVALSARSTMNVISSTIQNNSANGVQLSQGSAAIFQPLAPLSNLSGNPGFDLQCDDAESSHAGPLEPGAIISPTCTGF
jgi:hypothetical protein